MTRRALKPRSITPGEILFVGIVLFLVSVLVCWGTKRAFGKECLPLDYPPGTILLTRNLEERLNRNPGFFNHSAIVSGDSVIEAQPPYGVIKVPLKDFLSRRYCYTPCYPIDPAMGQRAAYAAESYVGRPYGRYASIGPGFVRNLLGITVENCTSSCADYYRIASGRPLYSSWLPDSIYRRAYYNDLLTLQRPAWADQPGGAQ